LGTQDSASASLPYGRPLVSASDRQRTYLLETSNGRCIRLSATAYFVLTRIDEAAAADEVAQELSHRLGRVVTAAHVQAAYAQVRQQVDAIRQQTRRPKPFGLWFRVRLLPISAVGALSRRLSGVFHPAAAVPLVLLSALAAITALAAGTSGHQRMMMDPGASFAPLLGLFIVSMFAHELGHASASMRYGTPARDIGFGLYLIYPVFYNDVTAAWRLTRRQRVVIDLAGVFFQFSVGAGYLFIYRLTGWGVFYLAAVSVFFLGLFVLLPIFKFDGYWLLTDLLGVDNLSRQVRRVAAHVLDRLRRRRGARLPWPSWVSVAVLAYGAFSVAYLFLFALRLASVLPDLAVAYPARVAGLLRDLYLPPHTPAPGRLASVLGPTYILLGVGLAALTLSMRLINALRPSLIRRGSGS
jgi:putative peptide zinc metalloprotease protein